MAEFPGEGGLSGAPENGNVRMEGKIGSSRRRASVRPSLDADEFINLLHGSDPVRVELNRLENEVRGEERELIRWLFSLFFLCYFFPGLRIPCRSVFR